MRNRLESLKPYAILLLVLLIAYLPVTTFYFGMKNDAFSDNFPNKFFLTESIRSGHMPLWNPYINYGLPVYADMGFAFYNPITWLFALIGYNAYALTAEVLFYIYVGGIFMLRLGRFFKFNTKTAIVIAAMYMCSGFYTGCLQYINFLTAAAFLPLALHTLLQLFNAPCFKNSFLFSLACYFIFAGGHPAIPIAFIYFLSALIVLLFLCSPAFKSSAKKIIVSLAISLGLLLLLYLPAIYSYVSILPVYARNGPAQQALSTQAGFTFQAWLSFIFPFSTVTTSRIFCTDVAMRNGFFGVVGFISVVVSLKTKQLYVRVLIITALLMLLLSAGGALKALLFSRLPLLQYVRYNGEYRVFSILCFSIIAGFGLEQLMTGDKAFTRRFKTALWVLVIACTGILIFLVTTNSLDIAPFLNILKQQVPVAQKVKGFLAGPFPWFLTISTALTLLVCVLSLVAVKKSSSNWLFAIILFDVVINCIIYLPVTGVGQLTLKSIQAVYNTSPTGIPVPPLVTVNKIDTLDAKTTGLVGDITYYNKLIGTTKLTDYPSYFASTSQYFGNQQMVDEVSRHPYLFVKKGDTANTHITVQHFKSAFIEMDVDAPQNDTLVFLQNNYRFWHAVINGQKVPIATTAITFMSVKIAKGANHVIFYYEDRWLGFCMLISLAMFIGSLSVIARQRFIGKSTTPNQ